MAGRCLGELVSGMLVVGAEMTPCWLWECEGRALLGPANEEGTVGETSLIRGPSHIARS